MIGAMVGDVVGSVYEWHNIKTKDFPLFSEECFFTDDTVMTCAVAEALMNGGGERDFTDAMRRYGRMYPDAGYGARFGAWLSGEDEEPYGSWGNGSAMRVSPVGFFQEAAGDDTPAAEAMRALAARSAEVTHNHPEGVKGAQAVADCILFMRHGSRRGDDMAARKEALRRIVSGRYGYDLSETLDEIRPRYRFDESCPGTVPQAIVAFLESRDFEDAIRNAVSLGGDSDTLAAITGGIAEAAYGVPEWIRREALARLDSPLLAVCGRWEKEVRPFGEA